MKYCVLMIVLLLFSAFLEAQAASQRFTCTTRRSRCFLRTMTCPRECPSTRPKDPKAKVCFVNCDSPICQAECRNRKPNCNGNGAACFDPRFIGADGGVFYFHGKSNQHFSLVSDHNLQINARFIGLRPAGRTRDYTWIQALGILYGSHTLSLEATKAESWDGNVDHLTFSYDGKDIFLPEIPLLFWNSPEHDVKIERISSKNSVIVSIQDAVEISVNVVPVTREDDRIHNYQIPTNDCFAHLEVQFRFLVGLSPQVEGVLGRTYQPDFENPARPGVAMPVVGGEDKYRTTSLLSAGCKSCIFNPPTGGLLTHYLIKDDSVATLGNGLLDCSSKSSNGYGIVCKK